MNCRLMEGSIFPNLSNLLATSYVELRLHNDKTKNAEQVARSKEIQELKKRLTGSEGSPIYLIIDPGAPDKVLDRFDGADLTGNNFREFLQRRGKKQ